MILYLDTSAVVKLFIYESGSEFVQFQVSEANRFASSKICKAEFSAALARSVRTKTISLELAENARVLFSQFWGAIIKIDLNDLILENAAELAWSQGLRRYDAIHLASAVYINSSKFKPVKLITYDKQLWDISNKIGIVTLPEDW